MSTIQPIITMFDFRLLLPEIFVLFMSCVVLLMGLFSERVTYILTQLTVVGAAILTLYNFNVSGMLFDGMYRHDALGALLKLFAYLVTAFVFLYARVFLKTDMRSELLEEGRRFRANLKPLQTEYYALGLFSLLGMMVLISSTHFMSFFLGLEILSLPLYAMVALDRNSALAAEASMKYFVTGAVASALLLYGFSMIYGATGSLSFTGIAAKLSVLQGQSYFVLTAGLVFALSGVLFKLGASPFHMWVPDVYEGGMTKVTLFVAGAPKIAAMGIIIRFLIDALPSLHLPIQSILIVVAVLSMLMGNLVAIVQTNLKRMLAYSSIAHVGYMLLGVIAATADGYAAAVFYVLVYSVMVASAFGVLVLMSGEGIEVENIRDLQGLNERSPWLAFMMLLTLFSMAGIPPLAGFFAKLGVLEALVATHFVWLAALALVFAIIGAYYYIAVIKVMYFEKPVVTVPIPMNFNMITAISLNGLSLLWIGLFPSGLIAACRQALQV
jgi:NADH-quinone oxidoreductase subunit N